MGSLNGTYVNRERIDAVTLSNGDEVQIGKYRLVFYASQRGVLTPSRPGPGRPPPSRRVPMPRTPGGAGDGTATTDGALLSIGAVLGQLRAEFPEVTISKIRFLEAEGLVEPQRTPLGVPQVHRGGRDAAWRTSCGCSGTTTCRCG